jgi:hypothetical protein
MQPERWNVAANALFGTRGDVYGFSQGLQCCAAVIRKIQNHLRQVPSVGGEYRRSRMG